MAVKGDLMKMLQQRVDKAQQYLSQQVKDDCEPYVPIKSGHLVHSAQIIQNGKAIKYLKPYARFQYGGLVMIDPVTRSPFARPGVKKILTNRPLKYSNPKAVAHWFRYVRLQNEKVWIARVREIITKGK